MLIFIGAVFVTVIVLVGILALVIVLVSVSLQQVNRSLYSLVADVKCSEVLRGIYCREQWKNP